ADRRADDVRAVAPVGARLHRPARAEARHHAALPGPDRPSAAAAGPPAQAAPAGAGVPAAGTPVQRRAVAAARRAAVAADPLHQLPVRVPAAAVRAGADRARRRADAVQLAGRHRRGGLLRPRLGAVAGSAFNAVPTLEWRLTPAGALVGAHL